MKIYLASSGRNPHFTTVRDALCAYEGEGSVYDFTSENSEFQWDEVDPKWKHWSVRTMQFQMGHTAPQRAFLNDLRALEECDACVMLMPCGRSAHMEAGFAAARRIPTAIYFHDTKDYDGDPDLMWLMGRIVIGPGELEHWLQRLHTCQDLHYSRVDRDRRGCLL